MKTKRESAIYEADDKHSPEIESMEALIMDFQPIDCEK